MSDPYRRSIRLTEYIRGCYIRFSGYIAKQGGFQVWGRAA